MDPNILSSLKASAVATGIFGFVLALILPLRAYTLWRRTRLVQLKFPCQDPQEARFRLMEALKFAYQAPPTAEGPFTIEPVTWRKKLGLAPIAVAFPQPKLALVTGPSMALSQLARLHKIAMFPAPGSPTYWQWIRPKARNFLIGLAIVFVIIFVLRLMDLNSHTPRPAPISADR
jgi:hypothetical protein